MQVHKQENSTVVFQLTRQGSGAFNPPCLPPHILFSQAEVEGTCLLSTQNWELPSWKLVLVSAMTTQNGSKSHLKCQACAHAQTLALFKTSGLKYQVGTFLVLTCSVTRVLKFQPSTQRFPSASAGYPLASYVGYS